MAYRGNEILSIGELAKRTGMAVSAIRFYADKGLLSPLRSRSGHRQFRRADIRRVSFILAAQRLGFTLPEIQAALDTLPDARTPTKADWAKLGRYFKQRIAERIQALQLLEDTLEGCIGCGCLSLQNCRLYNPEDQAAALGAGPRFLLGDTPETAESEPQVTPTGRE